jgi:predicted PhzF superfamily epimerase YddE/YHI9
LSPSQYTLDLPLQETGGPINVGDHFENIVQAVKAHDVVIIELPDEATVRNYVPSMSALREIWGRGVIVTSRGEGRYDFVSRYFVPKAGIDEDAVTGSAHCKLAHYWGQKLNKTHFLAYQASPRGGEIELSIRGDRVYLKGRAVTIMAGQWVV